MKAQVYELTTPLNFGKYKNSSLLQIINSYQSRYLGYLIDTGNPLFILSPKAIKELERKGYFDNLYRSAPCDGGSIPVNMTKQEIIAFLNHRYEVFISSPDAYNQKILEIAKANFRRKREKEREADESEIEGSSEYDELDGPYEFGSSQDPVENHWLDCLPDDEADAAYWNTQ